MLTLFTYIVCGLLVINNESDIWHVDNVVMLLANIVLYPSIYIATGIDDIIILFYFLHIFSSLSICSSASKSSNYSEQLYNLHL